MHRDSIRVILVDDHPMVREGLKHILSHSEDIKVVGEAGTTAQALQLLEKQKCDIALIDIALPDQSGLTLLRSIKHSYPQVRALMVSAFSENEHALAALQDGAFGFVAKSFVTEELISAIHVVAAGGKYRSPRVVDKLHRDGISDGPIHSRQLLSEREAQILQLIAVGKRVSEIAGELHLSAKTVSTYRTRILEKTGFQNNAEIVRFALERGLLS